MSDKSIPLYPWGDKDANKRGINQWLNQFEVTERGVLSELLQHFSYYDSAQISSGVIDLLKKFLENHNIDFQGLAFIPVYKESGVGFSDEFFNRFWIGNNILEYAEKNIYPLLEESSSITKIVIVDDYSGSGKTIERTIRRCIEKAINKEISFYILTLHMSLQAKNRIESFVSKEKITCSITTLILEDKCFDGQSIYSKDIDRSTSKNAYNEIWIKYKYSPDKYKYGFKEVQGLLSFEYNTPNNTLGIFWSDNSTCIPLLKRYKKTETTLTSIQSDHKKRVRQQRSDSFNNYEEPPLIRYFMLRLSAQDTFNYHEIQKECGLSEEQLDNSITYLLSNNLLQLKRGNFIVTEQFKEKIKTAKLAMINEEPKQIAFKMHENYLPKNFNKVFNGYSDSNTSV